MGRNLLLLFAVLLTALSASAYDFEVGGIYYNILPEENKTCEVTSGESKYSDVVTIPSIVTYSGSTYSVTSIGSRAFLNCYGLTSVEIPNSVTSIGEYAFSYCSGLTSVVIGNSVTTIGEFAFKECSVLTSVVIPNSVTSIGEEAFESCSGLTSVVIPNSVTSIGEEAFAGCTGLTSVEIPNSVTTIGVYAFSDCTGLKEIINLAVTPQTINESTFENVSKEETILKVPACSVDAYKADDYWNTFVNIVALDDFELFNGTPYTVINSREVINITYKRTFSHTNWQALYVPFKLDVVEDLGADYEVAEINGVHQFDTDGDGSFDETWMEFRTVKSGMLRANTPYVIKPAKTGDLELTLKNRKLYGKANNSVDCSTSRHLYTLTGTYEEVTDVTGKYAMKDGQFVQGIQGKHTIKPQRIYLTISPRDGGYGTSTSAKAPARICLMIDGEATVIDGLTIEQTVTENPTYNLQGVRVGDDYKGIVVRGGKKFINR